MILLGLICGIGLSAGFLLIRRVPVCAPASTADCSALSIIIPARNEEANLTRLLQSVHTAGSQPLEVLVVDDESTDNTALIAQSLGARLIKSEPLPPGWTGKSWACYQGALSASGRLLLFLDADTFLLPSGLDRMVSLWHGESDPHTVLSLLPYQEMSAIYEQFSLMFNILMAAGAGGFGVHSEPRLFGQSLLIEKSTYMAAGGHATVGGVVLENLRLAQRLTETGARLRCLSGRGTLHMRMFPDGIAQMSQSWAKAFVQGAADSGQVIVAYSIAWISALWLVCLIGLHGVNLAGALAVYVALAFQLAWVAAQFGRYRLLTCLMYPLPLGYYCAVFGWSALRRVLGRRPVWRGREV